MMPTRCRIVVIVIISMLFMAILNVSLLWDMSQKDELMWTNVKHFDSQINEDSKDLKNIITESSLKPNLTSHQLEKAPIKGPSVEHEQARREVERDSIEFWNYFQSELRKLQHQLPNTSKTARKVGELLNNGKTMQSKLRNDIDDLSNKVDGMSEWRYRESMYLGSLIQRRLAKIQHPDDCDKAKKLSCRMINSCGFGCEVHHVTYCLIMAYATNRTLILQSKNWKYSKDGWESVFLPLSTCTVNTHEAIPRWTPTVDMTQEQIVYLPFRHSGEYTPKIFPRAIPDNIADKLLHLNGNPLVWWVGQFTKYAMRPNKMLVQFMEERQNILGLNFTTPIVGIHVRRTDKRSEAAYHDIDEYMHHVVDWYDTYEQRHPGVERRVFIATDDPSCVKDARKTYPTYTFINDNNVSKSAAVNSRYSYTSLMGIVTDVYLLSKCNYVVCTFSSQICRASFELMQTQHGDASNYVHSLDDVYFYAGQSAYIVTVIQAHTAQQNDGGQEIDLQIGDTVSYAGNHWNGYSKGTNKRTGKTGLFPSYKIKEVITRVKTEDFVKFVKL